MENVRGTKDEERMEQSKSICPVSSDGRAPVLQTGSRKLETSTGYQFWGRRLIGRTPVLQTGNEGSSPSASTSLRSSSRASARQAREKAAALKHERASAGGHGSVAESDIASVGARVRFPLTAPGDVGAALVAALGAHEGRPYLPQVYGKWPSA